MAQNWCYHTPDHYQAFFLLGRILLGDLTPCLTILETLKVSVMIAFSFKEFSVLNCLKTIKIISISPELIALPLIAVGLLNTRDFITFILFYSCLKTLLTSFPF